MPAYNAELTLERTVQEVDQEVVDGIILVDDNSTDRTIDKAKLLKIDRVIKHEKNKGYGANQKTCYQAALEDGADVVIMLHPDYQYSPKLVVAIASMIAYDQFDFVLASRILGKGALKGGMPYWKYVANRGLTFVENLLVGYKLSEYHTGYRGYSRKVLETIKVEQNSDDFVFDNQVIAQVLAAGFRIGEISCPARYEPESSSINFKRSVKYGLGVLLTGLQYFLHRTQIKKFSYLEPKQLLSSVEVK